MSLSHEAQLVARTLFFAGEKSTVHSHEPHKLLTKYRSGFDELKAAGLISEKPYNKFGSIEFIGTEKVGEVARVSMPDILAPTPPEGAAP